MNIGEVLCKLIFEKNLTKKKIADELGYPYTTFISYTNNHREPGIKNLIRLADYFNVPIDALVGRSIQD